MKIAESFPPLRRLILAAGFGVLATQFVFLLVFSPMPILTAENRHHLTAKIITKEALF
jgi:hypothetical protein